MPLDELIRRVTDAVPTTLPHPPVVLHSNPGPTHVFVDPDRGRLTGLIDFGDSYAGHPVLDLHRWPDPADRIRLRDSYLEGDTPETSWNRMWTVAMIHTDLAMIAADSPHARAAID
jgi:aminoglycoside phosphotransferase (APT) family kinase protein